VVFGLAEVAGKVLRGGIRMNLAQLLVRSAQGWGERPAVFDGERLVHDYRGLARRVSIMAGRLLDECGLVPGDRVALIMHNHPAYVELLFASWHAGLVAVPVNAKLHAREFAYVLQHSGARLCFVTEDLASTIAELKPELPMLAKIVSVEGTEYRRLTIGELQAMAPRAWDDLAWLFYTSGTTGRPKGAMLTHRNLLAMTLAYFADVDCISPRDCILHAAPMSHGSGLYILPHVAHAAAQVVPYSGKFDLGEIFHLLRAHPGVSMFAAPTIVKRLVEHPAEAANLANLKTIVYGGAPMYLEDIRRAISEFGQKFVQIYGQGESPMTITALSREQHANSGHPRYLERLSSVGTAQIGLELRVADNEDRELPMGETGEVLVRGDAVMRGYWNDPEATATALRGGWLHTGDVGAFDADGFLTLKDRSKDLIISGGSNIYPREVEEVLMKHAGVREAAVVGRPHPEWGEEVVAFVELSGQGDLSESDLDALCREHIARFKRPKLYRFVRALPKNNYGKVLKTQLREWLAAETGGAATDRP
jgi:long-chain acyl-CoA synthetase